MWIESSDLMLLRFLKYSVRYINYGFVMLVTSVKSARQVIDALNAEGQYIDIILAEVDLPIKKGMKMLKYIARDKELRRIPIISKFWFFIFIRSL